MIHVLGLFFSSVAIADAPVDKGVRIHLERTVEASADQAWELLGERFDRLGEWSDGLESRALSASEIPQGMTADPDAPVPGRLVDDGRREQIQVLVDFDRSSRSFTFQAGNPPGVLAYAHNAHTIIDLGDGRARVDIDVVLVPRGIAKLLKGPIQRKFTAYMQDYLDQAATHVEQDHRPDGSQR